MRADQEIGQGSSAHVGAQINVTGDAHPSDLSRRVLASHDEARPVAIELELDVAPGDECKRLPYFERDRDLTLLRHSHRGTTSCDSLPENVDIEAVDKDPKTGQVEYDQYIYTPVSGYGNTGAQLDNDVVPYGTTYNITYYVKDASTGKVLATDTASATTPPLQ